MTATIKREIAVGITDQIEAALENCGRVLRHQKLAILPDRTCRETVPRTVHAAPGNCPYGKIRSEAPGD